MSHGLINNINTLNDKEKIHIYNILVQNNIKFTKNSNGYFFVLKDSDLIIIEKINNCINLINTNRELIHEMDNRREELIKVYKNIIDSKIKNKNEQYIKKYNDIITIKEQDPSKPSHPIVPIVHSDPDYLIEEYNKKCKKSFKNNKLYEIFKKFKKFKKHVAKQDFVEYDEEDGYDVYLNSDDIDDIDDIGDTDDIIVDDIIVEDIIEEDDVDVIEEEEKVQDYACIDDIEEDQDDDSYKFIQKNMLMYKKILVNHGFIFKETDYSELLHQDVNLEIVPVNKKRRLAYDKLYDLLQDSSRAFKIECHIYNYCLILYKNIYTSTSQLIWNKTFEWVYIDKFVSIRTNLDPKSYIKNTNLIKRYLNDEISEYKLVYSPTVELFPEKYPVVEIVEPIKDDDDDFESFIVCPQCGSKKVTYSLFNTRSGDESSTAFMIDVGGCGFVWTESN